MNRKSVASTSMRKSVRPRPSNIRESLLPSSGNVPSSSRRGFANRTILDQTRSSLGGRQLSFYGNSQPKDGRQLNDEFILSTFRRLKEFFEAFSISCDLKYSIPKLTAKQFEYVINILVSHVCVGFTPPQAAKPGTSWLDTDLPILMESLDYPTKVTKSMIQGVSAKPGPAVAIIDYLLDFANANSSLVESELQYLSQRKDQNADLENLVQEFAQTHFTKTPEEQRDGLESIRERIIDVLKQQHEFLTEDEILEEIDKVDNQISGATERLQTVEQYVQELEEEIQQYEQNKEYLTQMNTRYQHKLDNLNTLNEECARLTKRIEETKSLIEEANVVIAKQPLSAQQVQSISQETQDLKSSIDKCVGQIKQICLDVRELRRSTTMAVEEIDSCIEKTASSLHGTQCPISKEQLLKIIDNHEEIRNMINKIQSLNDKVCKELSVRKQELGQKIFNLEHEERALRTQLGMAKQDKEGYEKRLQIVSEQVQNREHEFMRKRKSLQELQASLFSTKSMLSDLTMKISTLKEEKAEKENALEVLQDEKRTVEVCMEEIAKKIEAAKACDEAAMLQTVENLKNWRECFPVEALCSKIVNYTNCDQVQKALETVRELSE